MHILRLPDELLLEIFDFLEEWSTVLKPWDWIVVTHVCRRWRHTAVDCPSLWVYPDFAYHSQERLKAFLSRSRHLPIILDDRHEGDNDIDEDDEVEKEKCVVCDKNIEFAVQNLSKLRFLRLENFEQDVLNLVTRDQVSRLEGLDLRKQRDGTPPTLLQNDFLSEPIPTLWSIDLRGYILPSDSVLFKGLINLVIMDRYGFVDGFNACSTFYPSMEELFCILEACPELSALELDYVKGSTLITTERRYQERISMSHLVSIVLGQLDVSVAKLIAERVDIPNLAMFHIGLRYSTNRDTAEIVSVIRQLAKGVSHNGVTVSFIPYATFIRSEASGCNDLVLAETGLSLYRIDEDGELLSNEYSDLADVIQIMTALFHETPYTNLTSLNIESTHPYRCESSIWSSFFTTIPKTTYVGLLFQPEYPNDPHWQGPGRISMVEANNNILMGLHTSSVLPDLQSLCLKGIEIQTVRRNLTCVLDKVRMAGRTLKLILNGSKGKEEYAEWLKSENFGQVYIEWIE